MEDEDYTINVDDTLYPTLAWVIPVDATLIGARLEAYRESKNTVNIFAKISAKSGHALAEVPTEVMNIVFIQLQELLFEERILW